MPRKHLLCLAISGLVLVAAHSTTLADASCSVSGAAAVAAPPEPAPPTQKQFRIFWHVATQIEDLADAHRDKAAMKDVRDVQSMVDGYYFNLLTTGPLVYWPDRPKQCAANFKRIQEGDSLEIDGDTYQFPGGGGAGRESCEAEQAEAQRELGFDDTVSLQYAAMGRVLDNLRLDREQAAGKEVIGVLIIDSRDMDYDQSRDAVELKQLPKTLCFFNNEGFAANAWMTYQEPNIQIKRGNFVWIPQKPKGGGKPVRSKDPKADKAPENPRVYDLVEDAFRREGIYYQNIYANMRRWNRRTTPDLARELASLKEIRGFNFEGGAAVPDTKPRKMRNYAEGIAWVLENTDKNVSILMPGYWDKEDIGTETEIDTLPKRTRDYVVTINNMVTKIMGLPKGQNALCTGRVILIPGSYGKPLHVKTLPSIRNGKPAGTVTGNIRMLDGLRKELCGG